jgi:fucose permease
VLGSGGALIVVASIGLLAFSGSTAPVAATPPQKRGRPLRRRLASRPLVLLGAMAAVAYLVENAWQSWAAIQLHASTGAPLRTAAAAPAVFAGAAAVGRFSGHRLIARVRPAALVAAGAVTAAAGSALAGLTSVPAAGMAGIAIAGLGTAVCAPTLISLSRHHSAPSDHGAATGTVVTIAYLGFVFRNGAGVGAGVSIG